MCGRLERHTSAEKIAHRFAAALSARIKAVEDRPRYNLGPRQTLATVRVEPRSGERTLDALDWGLLTPWSRQPQNRPINARAETVERLPTFRAAFRQRRALVPADAFYEWDRTTQPRQPYLFRHAEEGELLALAALWERVETPDGPHESLCLLTCPANARVGEIHDRMPVILAEKDWTPWLDPGEQEATRLKSLLRPFPAEKMRHWPVSTRLNRIAEDNPGLLAEVTPVAPPPSLFPSEELFPKEENAP